MISTVANYAGWTLHTHIPGRLYTLTNPQGWSVNIRDDEAMLIAHEIYEYEADGVHPADYCPDLWDIAAHVFNLTQHGPKGAQS